MNRLVACIFLLFSIQCVAQQPSPALSPIDVVTFQLHSLQTNSDGEGIEATFRFASPANKIATGPLNRFKTLFDHAQYKAMLNHRSAEIKLISNNEIRAELLTEIIDNNGLIHHYRFRLSRQSSGQFINCWMTDAVSWEPKPGRSA